MAGFVFDSPRATRERHISKIIYNVVVESGKAESYVNTNNKGFNKIEHEKNHAKTSEKRTGTSDYCSLSINNCGFRSEHKPYPIVDLKCHLACLNAFQT
jgi:hypothetical protein